MEIKEVIEVLQHCGKPGSDCHNCKMYQYSASCLKKLCNEAAAALESQQKRIAELEEKNRWIPVTEPPKEKAGIPTSTEATNAYYILRQLADMAVGVEYMHNFQRERSDIVDYVRKTHPIIMVLKGG